MKQRTFKTKQIGVVLLLGLLLWGCISPKPHNLPFETIAAGPFVRSEGKVRGSPYMMVHGPVTEEPAILIIAAPDQVNTPGLGVQFPSDLADQLRAIDYGQQFVIAVFRELLDGQSPEYTAEIRQVLRQGDKVVVQAHFGKPGPESGRFPAFSRPYRIIAVSKEGQWDQEIRFVLKVDDWVVSERTHFVP